MENKRIAFIQSLPASRKMKKILILISIQVQLISSIFAQSQIGFKGGFNH